MYSTVVVASRSMVDGCTVSILDLPIPSRGLGTIIGWYWSADVLEWNRYQLHHWCHMWQDVVPCC